MNRLLINSLNWERAISIQNKRKLDKIIVISDQIWKTKTTKLLRCKQSLTKKL